MKNNITEKTNKFSLYKIGKLINENEIKEGEFTGLVKNLKGDALETKISALATAFRVDENTVKSAFATDATVLEKNVDKAIQSDIKNGIRGNGTALGPLTKTAAKQQAIKEILSSNKVLTEREISEIIEKYKSEAKNKAFAAETKVSTQPATKGKSKIKSSTGKDIELTATTDGAGAKVNSNGSVTITEPAAAGETPKPPVEVPKTKIDELVDGIKNKKWNWKQILKWGAGITGGLIGVWGLWWIIKKVIGTGPDDMPKTEPVIGGNWAPCLQELLKNKEAQIGKSEKGEISVVLKPDEYPGGLQFYPNGKVLNVSTKQMGTWKCKGGQAVVSESKKLSFSNLLNEQGAEIDEDTMKKYVNTAVDDLDGYVDTGNLNSLKSILTALKGKTFRGGNAISEFLSLYKEDEGGDDFITDVKSVGIKTLGTPAILAKRDILSLAQGASGATTQTTPSGKIGLKNIEISFDNAKKEGGGENPKPKKSPYHDCSSKDFPFEFGCIAPQIAEIQGCLGVHPQKGYFGPKTKKALEDAQFADGSNTITKAMYDKIKTLPGCASPTTTTTTDDDNVTLKNKLNAEPISTAKPKGITAPQVSGDLTKLPTLQAPTAGGKEIYDALSANYGDGTNPEYPYIFAEGGRIKYKGEGLPEDALNKLNGYISSLGYQFTPMKQKRKEDYGFKYVWTK